MLRTLLLRLKVTLIVEHPVSEQNVTLNSLGYLTLNTNNTALTELLVEVLLIVQGLTLPKVIVLGNSSVCE